MQNIISLDTEKLARRGFQHEGPPPPNTHTHTEETLGGAGSPAPPVPTPMNVSKHLTDWLGVSTVELCAWKKGNVGGILRYVQPQKWGGGDLLPPPLPGKWGGERPPCPPCSYAYARPSSEAWQSCQDSERGKRTANRSRVGEFSTQTNECTRTRITVWCIDTCGTATRTSWPTDGAVPPESVYWGTL